MTSSSLSLPRRPARPSCPLAARRPHRRRRRRRRLRGDRQDRHPRRRRRGPRRSTSAATPSPTCSPPPASRPASATRSSPPPTAPSRTATRSPCAAPAQLELVVDGTPRTVWVTAASVDEALDQVGLGERGLALSASRSRDIPLDGMRLAVSTPKTVHRRRSTAARCRARPRPPPSATRSTQAGVAVDGDDRLSARPRPPRSLDGLAVNVVRVEQGPRAPRDPPCRTPPSAARTPRLRRGPDPASSPPARDGRVRRTFERTFARRRGSRTRTEIAERDRRRARRRASSPSAPSRRPPPRPRRRAPAAARSSSSRVLRRRRRPSGGFAALAQCESGGNPRATNPSGKYRGLYQFSRETWASVGGSGDPAAASRRRADQARADAAQRAPAPASGRSAAATCASRAALDSRLAATGLLTAADVRALADALHLRPTKTLGQNFVIDPNTVRRLVRTAGVGVDDVVVEVGPGLGSLTLGLLEVADARRRRRGRRRARRARCPAPWPRGCRSAPTGSRSSLQDALTLVDVPGPPPTAFVANLPYNVAVPVLLRLLEHLPSLRTGLVMVQAEVADRLVAPPGQPDVRRPVGEGRLVRRRPPGRRRSAAPSSGRRRTSTRGLVAFTRREPPPGDRRGDLRRRRRRLRAAPQDPARGAGRLGRARRPRPSSGCAPPASTRARAARCCRVEDFARLAATARP